MGGRRKALQRIKRNEETKEKETGGEREERIRITEINLRMERKKEMDEKIRTVNVEMGNQKKEKVMVRKIHQRSQKMEAKIMGEKVKKIMGEMEEIMSWRNQLTTSFGVLIFHWSRFWKNVWKIR